MAKRKKKKIVKKKINKKLVYFLLGFFILFLIGLVWFFKDLPSPTDLVNNPPQQTTKLLDRNGKLLYNVYTDVNRTPVTIDKIPKDLINATIAVEDKNFYHHLGVDLVGIFRATVVNFSNQPVQGGSTITQQLVKMSLLTPERTLTRKIKEAVLALWIERIYSKDKILEMYLNRVPYGGTAYGIEEASQYFFNKHASELTFSESTLLAGLPQAPTYYSPFGTDPQRSVDRQKLVIERMREDNYQISNIDQLKFASKSANFVAPHFVAQVREELAKKYGEEKVARGGLKVTTTLDLDLQKDVEATLSAEIEKQKSLKVGNGAALITNPETGEILAMIGSKDYFATDGGKVNIVNAERSPGSSIKPLNFALGLLKGNTTAATPWIDQRYCFPPASGRDKPYCPQNYDAAFHGVVQTRFALGNSFNIPAVKELALNTIDDFIATASAMGITTFGDKNRFGYSLTLGGGEVKMSDMAVAFGVFANAGRRQPLISILKVEDNLGNILEELSANPYPLTAGLWDGTKLWTPYDNWVLPQEVTFLISHILLDDGARSATFGGGSVLNIPGVSVKTGTTEDKRDNWSIGYTSGKDNRLVAVWVGNNDNSPMSPYLESGNTGAAPIWNKLMRRTLKDIQKVEWPQKPETVNFVEICSLSGMLPANDCPKRGEYFIKAFTPRDTDNVWNQKRKVWVFKDTRKQATGNFNPDSVVEEDHMVLSDPLQKDYCVDCPL
ncbi:MAG: transglycosylase domain-containing protein [bacterium]|nr:transglycosylase domain-containing protein [bacterium]